MALMPLRQTNRQAVDFVTPFHIERGGILSLTTLSGVQYAVYEMNPSSSTVPLGLMQYDTEEVDLYRANAPWKHRNAFPELTPLPYIIEGNIITNAIDSTVTNVTIGQPAYLAPSGMITNSTKYGTSRVGTFMSVLNAEELGVIHLPTQIRVAGNQAIVDPDPVFARSAGWCKISINIT
jgi:hypothetical protein